MSGEGRKGQLLPSCLEWPFLCLSYPSNLISKDFVNLAALNLETRFPTTMTTGFPFLGCEKREGDFVLGGREDHQDGWALRSIGSTCPGNP